MHESAPSINVPHVSAMSSTWDYDGWICFIDFVVVAVIVLLLVLLLSYQNGDMIFCCSQKFH